ncbi:MAG: hypothetical protein E7213_06660 [Clostridium sp.]|nr:hypothetical protein [Clostridium sp.]
MKNGFYAIYKGEEFECSFFTDDILHLISNRERPGFDNFMGTYSMKVKRKECERVYRRTLNFKYENDDFLIREEKGEMVLLETGPRSYDLKKLGFKKILNDTFQKWVNVNEGERYWYIKEY